MVLFSTRVRKLLVLFSCFRPCSKAIPPGSCIPPWWAPVRKVSPAQLPPGLCRGCAGSPLVTAKYFLGPSPGTSSGQLLKKPIQGQAEGFKPTGTLEQAGFNWSDSPRHSASHRWDEVPLAAGFPHQYSTSVCPPSGRTETAPNPAGAPLEVDGCFKCSSENRWLPLKTQSTETL